MHVNPIMRLFISTQVSRIKENIDQLNVIAQKLEEAKKSLGQPIDTE